MLGNGGGRIEPVIENGVLLIRVRLNDLDPDAQGTISGTVLDSRGLPVERAWVSLAFVYREGGGALPSNSVCHTVTNAGGEFLIRSVPKNLNGVPLQFSLVVSKDGLAGTDTPPVEFRPQGRDSIHRVDPVRLGVEGTIRGKVLDDRGLPAVGARVSPGSRYSATQPVHPDRRDGAFRRPRNTSRNCRALRLSRGPGGVGTRHGRWIIRHHDPTPADGEDPGERARDASPRWRSSDETSSAAGREQRRAGVEPGPVERWPGPSFERLSRPGRAAGFLEYMVRAMRERSAQSGGSGRRTSLVDWSSSPSTPLKGKRRRSAGS